MQVRASGVLILCALLQHAGSRTSTNLYLQPGQRQNVPLRYRQSRLPHRGIPGLAALRGGAAARTANIGDAEQEDEERDTVMSHVDDDEERTLVIPTRFPSIPAAVDHGRSLAKKDPKQVVSVEVRHGVSDVSVSWGFERALIDNVTLSKGCWDVRTAEGVDVSGPLELAAGSQGVLHRLRWNWRFHMSSPAVVGIEVRGGPWLFRQCKLRCCDTVVLETRGAADVSLEDCFVGGEGTAVSATITEASDGINAGGTSRVVARDCTFQFCGLWRSAACRARDDARLSLERCFWFENLHLCLALHDRARVHLSDCALLHRGLGAFGAEMAAAASLFLRNVTVEGAKWADERRPGVFNDTRGAALPERVWAAPALSAGGGPDGLERVLAAIDERAEDIEHDWAQLSEHTAGDVRPVLAAIEAAACALGGTVTRVRTGRQRLACSRAVMEAVENNRGMSPEAAAARLEALEAAAAHDLNGTDDDANASHSDFEELPPLLFASFPAGAPGAPTVTAYVHVAPYVLSALRNDVYIAQPEALLVEHSDRFLSHRRFGDDPARVFAWLVAVRAFNQTGRGLPCNLNLLVDFLEEAHLPILSRRVMQLAAAPPSAARRSARRRKAAAPDGGATGGASMAGTNLAVVCASHWLSPARPALVVGFRGLAAFTVRLAASTPVDLHSGTHGGAAREVFPDLLRLLASIFAEDGSCVLPCVRSRVERPPSAAERKALEGVALPGESYADAPAPRWMVGAPGSAPADEGSAPRAEGDGEDTVAGLARLWLRPSLSLHGIEGDWGEPGVTTVLPGALTAKLSVRLVPGLSADEMERELRAHLEAEAAALRTPHELSVARHTAWDPWRAGGAELDSGGGPRGGGGGEEAAARALQRVFGVAPDRIFDGGSHAVPGLLATALPEQEVVVLPLTHRETPRVECADDILRQTARYMLAGAKTAASLLDEFALATR